GKKTMAAPLERGEAQLQHRLSCFDFFDDVHTRLQDGLNLRLDAEENHMKPPGSQPTLSADQLLVFHAFTDTLECLDIFHRAVSAVFSAGKTAWYVRPCVGANDSDAELTINRQPGDLR